MLVMKLCGCCIHTYRYTGLVHACYVWSPTIFLLILQSLDQNVLQWELSCVCCFVLFLSPSLLSSFSFALIGESFPYVLWNSLLILIAYSTLTIPPIFLPFPFPFSRPLLLKLSDCGHTSMNCRALLLALLS